MVNGIRRYGESDGEVRWLLRDDRGLIGLPIWIDRQTTRGMFQRFSLGERTSEFDDRAWVSIVTPANSSSKSKSRRSRQSAKFSE
jgi:CRISPR-associated protein Cas5t